MKRLSDEEIRDVLSSKFGTDHERFLYIAEAQMKADAEFILVQIANLATSVRKIIDNLEETIYEKEKD